MAAALAHNATAPLANATLVPQAAGPEVLAGAAGATTATGAASASGPLGVAGDAASAVVGAAPPMPLPLDSAFSWGGYFQAIAVLAVLLGVLWAAVWLVRKFGKFNFMPQPGAFPRDALRMEAQLPLGPRKGLVVVRFLDRRILLGVTDHQVTYLTEAGHSDEHEQHDGADFRDMLEEARRQKPDA